MVISGKYLTQKEQDRLTDATSELKHQCKLCGRKELISFKEKKVLCSHCGHYIYKDDEEYSKYLFKLRIRRELKK